MNTRRMISVLLIVLISGLALGQTVIQQSRASGEPPKERERIQPDSSPPPDVSRHIEGTFHPTSKAMAVPPPIRHLWEDVDGNGLKDLFVLHGQGNLLLRNLGDGGFEDITALAFPDGTGSGGTGFWGDFDGDEKRDLFLFHEEGFTLFKNKGNFRFMDVTKTLGLDPGMKSGGVKLEDYDGDGFQDLMVNTPEGDRIYRNREGREFGEVALSIPARRGFGTRSTVKTVPPAPPIKSPGGQASSGGSASGTFNWDGLYINDNSPGSVGVGIPEVEGGDDGTTQNDIVDDTVTEADLKLPLSLTHSSPDPILQATNTGSGNGLNGYAQAASGNIKGVYGECDSMNGSGVMGYATASSGNTHGVYGTTDSESGKGVLGRACSSTGTTYGVYGFCGSNEGTGVGGHVSATTGTTRGVYGKSDSIQGTGVYGYASSTGGITYGVYGQSDAPIDGKGVYGTAPDYGVYGYATATSGTAYGVYGKVDSLDGYAGYFEGKAISGVSNSAPGLYATINGGYGNFTNGQYSTISGGLNNKATYTCNYTAIGGGEGNNVTGAWSTIGGGFENIASEVGGTIAGGYSNEAGGSYAAIGGGYSNLASATGSTVGGGSWNEASGGQGATVGGGYENTAGDEYAVVCGGYRNTASGQRAMVVGGLYCTASGVSSFAAGNYAQAVHDGAFVLADSTGSYFTSTGNDQFLIRASGGVGINTDDPGGFDLAVDGSAAKPGGGSWSVFSDARLKKDIEPLGDALGKLLELRGVSFEYKDPEAKFALPGRQIGLIAQEVEEAFPEWVDEDDEGYKYVTVRGLEALVVEALRELREEKDAQIEAQKNEIADLRARLEALEALSAQGACRAGN